MKKTKLFCYLSLSLFLISCSEGPVANGSVPYDNLIIPEERSMKSDITDISISQKNSRDLAPIFEEDEIINFTNYKKPLDFIGDYSSNKKIQNQLLVLFSKIKFQRKAYNLENPQRKSDSKEKTVPSWCRYQKKQVTKSKISKGIEFWKKHESDFSKYSSTVDPFILLSTLGIETIYGGYTGSFPALDTLITLAFTKKSRRPELFTNELRSLFDLFYQQAHFSSDDINDWHDFPRGSYAAALGLPQFLPSNYLNLAQDADGDGKIDLWKSIPDVVLSMSSYYEAHSWDENEPVGFRVDISNPKHKEIVSRVNQQLKPWIKVGDLRKWGVKVPQEVVNSKKASLFLFECPESPSSSFYWLGLHNFYVITRYNHSAFYAMSVELLKQKIQEELTLKQTIQP